jgi:alkylhydroperoxidase family enzyme
VLGKELVDAVLADVRTAPVNERVRAMLVFLEKLAVVPDEVSAEDVRQLREAGISRQAIDEAVQVCVLFSIIVRMADALDFEIPSADGFSASADHLLKRGYS